MMFIIACYESSRVIGAVGYSLAMKSIEAETLINARSSTVWDIITDAGDYSVWDRRSDDLDGRAAGGSVQRSAHFHALL